MVEEGGISKLITALQIFLKYGDPEEPTHCEHDQLYVYVDPEVVSEEDKKRLDKLGFFPGDDGSFRSYKYGSC
jgi:hypothetical protein